MNCKYKYNYSRFFFWEFRCRISLHIKLVYVEYRCRYAGHLFQPWPESPHRPPFELPYPSGTM